ncbi:flagellar basal body rod protein FlgB [Shewanella sp. YIC-542]|uniref:flagellar basal body rod protein FlgB n=1 Tax=Shewanella mytili TaxID=3377111 RepID=UPI00398EBEBD
MAISFDKALGIHQYTLGIRAQRAEVLSGNIANADTPNYRAKDVDFSAALQSARSQQQGRQMVTTSEKHFDMKSLVQENVKFRIPNQPDTGDGNTVDMQEEQQAFMQNALEYQMSLGFLSGKFSGMKKAIRGD